MIHVTRELLTRSDLTPDAVRCLAWLEGATHDLQVSADAITYYRHATGLLEAATAARDGDTWTLSAWTARPGQRLPQTARRLARPSALA